MKLAPLFAGIMLALLVAGPVSARSRNVTDADAPRSLPAEGPVSIDWTDPAQFSDIRYSGNRWEAERGNWVEQLAMYLQKNAVKKLPQGETLQVTFTDIKRAGSYEPWHGPNMNNTRVVRDIYPPRITLTFKRLDAQGQVIEQGERKLSDPGFLSSSPRLSDSDPLRYEKGMLDDWLKREFKSAAGA
ncbi:MAG: DUF3016 domain-containing protein [Pseudoxanthomonas sp.]